MNFQEVPTILDARQILFDALDEIMSDSVNYKALPYHHATLCLLHAAEYIQGLYPTGDDGPDDYSTTAYLIGKQS